MNEYLNTAVIRKPFGVKGYMKVQPFADDSSHFFKLKEVIAKKDDVRIVLEIETVQEYQEGLLVKFRGIDTPEDAKTYSGFNLLVPRNLAAGLEEGEVYTADLIGLKLIYNNEECGIVESIIDGAANLLLEIKCKDGLLKIVPYLKGVFVGDVNLEDGTLQLLKKDLIQ